MKRVSQSLVLILLGGAVLRVSAFSTTYLNYVKPGFRPFLIAAGAVVLVIGSIGLYREWRTPRPGEKPAHDHSHGPRVAWLMCLPVFALFLISPPALGSFAASRVDSPPPVAAGRADAYKPLSADGPTDMAIGEFIGRAWGDRDKTLAGKTVRLTGFVVPAKKKGLWYVTRMQIACCAADAFPLKVAVHDAAAPPADTWVEVTGTWIQPRSSKIPLGTVAPDLSAAGVERITAPSEPYE